jgi:hypothetical protein
MAALFLMASKWKCLVFWWQMDEQTGELPHSGILLDFAENALEHG